MLSENVWSELEQGESNRDGELRRRLLTSSNHEVFAVVVFPSRERQLVLQIVDEQALGLRLEQSQIVRLELVQVLGLKIHELRFRLLASDATSVFTAFCSDLIEQLSRVDNRADGLGVLYSRYLLWRRLLVPAADQGLTRPQQQGLYGELLMLKELMSGNNHMAVVDAWFGPLSGTTDFVSSGCGLEVKTVASHAPEIVRISSETQLSLVGLQSLKLCVYILVVRDNGAGNSLPELVDEIRSQTNRVAISELEMKLISAGYHDIHREIYSRVSYSLVERRSFSVVDGFPSIRSETLQRGIGNVSYDLSLDACAPFAETKVDSFTDALGEIR
jgi:hypothetical protein